MDFPQIPLASPQGPHPSYPRGHISISTQPNHQNCQELPRVWVYPTCSLTQPSPVSWMLLADGGLLGQRQRTVRNLQQCSRLRTSGLSTLSLIPRTPALLQVTKRDQMTPPHVVDVFQMGLWARGTHTFFNGQYTCLSFALKGGTISKAVHKTHLPQGSTRAESSQCRNAGDLRRVSWPSTIHVLIWQNALPLGHGDLDMWFCGLKYYKTRQQNFYQHHEERILNIHLQNHLHNNNGDFWPLMYLRNSRVVPFRGFLKIESFILR